MRYNHLYLLINKEYNRKNLTSKEYISEVKAAAGIKVLF